LGAEWYLGWKFKGGTKKCYEGYQIKIGQHFYNFVEPNFAAFHDYIRYIHLEGCMDGALRIMMKITS
jgi:hypothetical protein